MGRMPKISLTCFTMSCHIGILLSPSIYLSAVTSNIVFHAKEIPSVFVPFLENLRWEGERTRSWKNRAEYAFIHSPHNMLALWMHPPAGWDCPVLFWQVSLSIAKLLLLRFLTNSHLCRRCLSFLTCADFSVCLPVPKHALITQLRTEILLWLFMYQSLIFGLLLLMEMWRAWSRGSD